MTTLKSKKRRNTSPVVDAGELKMLVESHNSLAFKLYHTIRDRNTNLFFSPYSILTGLALAYAGARGETEMAMAKALSLTLPQTRLHAALNDLDLSLARRAQEVKGQEAAGFQLHVVNALWGQKGYKFLSQFLDTLAEYYGAELRVLDFAGAAEESRVAINQWISDETEEKIRDLVPEGVIDPLTRLILTNAIYFKAAWQYPFNASATAEDIFHLANDIDITVPMMQQTKSFRYTESEDFQAVELPYGGSELAMVILLPKAGKFLAFEENLGEDLFRTITEGLTMQEVALTLPKFEYDFSFGLKETLSTLGMRIAFTSEADFSWIDGKYDLCIQDVLHKAFVAVDEAGTTAAAATAVIMTLKAIAALAMEMKVDHPFIFFIRDIPTGSLLFIGRVLNPAK
jgi:serpin B